MNDLRSPGLFGKRPVIGLTMLFIGVLIFLLLAFNLIYNGPLIPWDLSVNKYLHNLALNSPAWVTGIMIASFDIGYYGPMVLGVLFGLYFFKKRFWRELVLVALAIGGGGLLFKILSETFMRPRPFTLFDKLIWSGGPNLPGFPSGHALSIVVLCGFLVYLILPKIKSYRGKVLIVLIALLMMLYIGFGQMYLGDHYLTDILAGYAIGLAWFGISVTFVDLLFQKDKTEKIIHENYRKSNRSN